MNRMDRYRAAIGAVNGEVSVLSKKARETVADGTALGPLRSSWAELLGHLVPVPASGRARPGLTPAKGSP